MIIEVDDRDVMSFLYLECFTCQYMKKFYFFVYILKYFLKINA